MNAFIPQNPKVVVLVGIDGKVRATANNIDPELQVVTTPSVEEFNEATKGIPFVAVQRN